LAPRNRTYMIKFYPKLTLLSVLFTIACTATQAQISTIAGRRYYLGDNGQATNAGLFNPYAITVDSAGTIYIASRKDNRVRKVDAGSKIITTIAGTGVAAFSGDGGLATAAQLNLNVGLPGLAVDKSGNVYIADYFNNRIRKVDASTKIITTIAGTGTAGYSGDGGAATSAKLNGPAGIVTDASGNIFFTDNNNNVVRRIDGATKIITTYAGNGNGGFGGDGGAATSAMFNYPEGIALDAKGNLFIADEYNYVVRKVDAATKVITTVAGTNVKGNTGDGGAATAATMGFVLGIAVDTAGNIFVVDQSYHTVRKITAATKAISTIAGAGYAGYSGDNGPATAALLNKPTYLQLDKAGNIYINDMNNGVIRKIAASNGYITTVAGDGTDGFTGAPDALKAQLSPQGVAVDGLGTYYIADGLYYDVRAVNVANSSYAFAGVPNPDPKYASKGYAGNGGIANAGLYNAPYAVAVDASANVYIADVFNNVIRKINYNTKYVTTVAGNATAGFSGDNAAATSAQLNNPYGVALDNNGNLYIADALNNRIRKVTVATGVITTIAGTGTAGSTGDGAVATAALLSNPRGVAVDANGNVFILDRGNNKIRKITAATQVISTVLTNGHALTGVATDASGNVFVSDSTAGTIVRLEAFTYTATVVAGTGTPGYADNASSSTLGQLNYPGGLTVNSDGTILVADINNNVVRKITPPAAILLPIKNNIISTVDSVKTCTGKINLTTLAGTLPTAGIGTYTYSWLQSTDNITYTAVTGATAQNYTVGAAITKTTYYRRLVVSGNYKDTSNVLSFLVSTSPVPVITVKGALAICKGAKDTLLTTIAYSKYVWSTGETTASIIDTVSRTNTVTVTDAAGCTATSAAVTITVNALPAVPTITSSVAASACPGTIVTLTSSAAAKYKWSTGATTAAITTTAAGNYTVTVTDANGCSNTSTAKAVTYATVTAPTITSVPATTTNVCPGTTVTLTSSSASAYKWSTSATTAAISPTTAGSYTVTITDANGCTATSAAKTVSYATVTTPTITSSPATTTNICPGTTVTLTSSTATKYKWSTSATTAAISTTAAGSYTVTITDANGCTATSAAKAVSYATVTTPTITSSPATTTNVCPGTTVTLTSSTASKYKWSTSATTAAISTTAAGSYTVTITDANGCTATSAAKAVSYATVTTPTITSSPATTTNVCPGTTVTLTSSSASAYKWSTGATTDAISPTAAGSYTVTTTDANGCTATSAAKAVSYATVITPTITTTPATTTNVCPGTTVTLASSPASKYSWSTGATTAATSTTAAGSYTVTTTDANGCTAKSAAKTVSYATVTTPTITSSPAVTTNICAGTAVTLTSSTASAYKWSTGVTTAAISTTTAGSYTVTTTDANGCTATSAAKVISYAACAVPVTASASATGTTATIKWKKASCAVKYTIQYALSTSTTWKSVTTTTADTTYTLTGLAKSTKYQWKVSAICSVSPSVVSAYSAVSTFTTTSAASIMVTGAPKTSELSAEVEEASFGATVYPNPTVSSAILNVSGNTGKAAILVTDMSGRPVWKTVITGNQQVTIPAQNFAAGMYLVNISNEKDRKVIKLIKQ